MPRTPESRPNLVVDPENAAKIMTKAMNPRVVFTLLAAMIFSGAAFIFFGLGSPSNDNFPDPEDDFWKKFFNPKWPKS